ncbi:MAG: acyl-CoA dehydrogenase [Myxococcota bacterium]
MRFAFTDDQKMLRDTVREVLQRECTPDVVRQVWEGQGEGAASVWGTLAETGVIGMMATEASGGMSMTEVDSVLLFEETGYAALPGPLVDTLAVGVPLLEAAATESQRDRYLEAAVAGELRVVAVAEGEDTVAYAITPDVLVAQRASQTYCVPWDEIAATAETSVDRARHLAKVSFEASDPHRMRNDVDHEALWALAKRRATVATSAQLVGLSRRMLDMSVAYVKDREQFGKPIGAQQAVKHRLADALIQQEFARPMAYRAAWSLATEAPSVEVDVSMAKAYASDAAKFVARQALQVHGAIGYTIEYDLHMWMKRVWALAASHGDAAHHRALIAEHIL